MLTVRSDSSLPPRFTASTNLLVNNVVVPALRRAIGAVLVLPGAVHLKATYHLDGHVPARFNPTTGEVISIDEPIVCFTENHDVLCYVLTHELAHYHELSLRRARQIRVMGNGPTQLWSEYFAQRVAWETSSIKSDSWPLAGGSEGVVEVAKEGGEAYSWAYMLTFMLAHADAAPEMWLEAYPGKENFLRIFVSVLQEDGVSDRLFRSFPNWSKADADLAAMLFNGLLKFSRRHRPK